MSHKLEIIKELNTLIETSILPGIVGLVMCAMWFLTALFLY